jgi:hypothetical protein
MPPNKLKTRLQASGHIVAPPIAPSLNDLADAAKIYLGRSRAGGAWAGLIKQSPADKRASKMLSDAVGAFCRNNPLHPLVEEFSGGAPYIRWGNVDRWLRDGGDERELLTVASPEENARWLAQSERPTFVTDKDRHDAEKDAEVSGFRN